jgi:pimeloyl-ACP methyl ester carboxylesterase
VSPSLLHHIARGPADATPVVFLHGLGSSAADWDQQVPAFAARHRAVMVDLPGHGGSPRGPGPGTVEAMAQEVMRVVDAVAGRPAHLVGLSLGACVAIAMACAQPERVRSLVLVNAFARLRPAGLRGGFRMLTRLALLGVAPMERVAAHVARDLFPRPDQRPLYAAAVASLGRASRRSYLAGVAALTRFDARRRLAAVRCPVLVVAGADDRTVPLAAKQALAAAIAGARLVVVPGSGHATPHDRAADFNRLVLEFVDAH